MSQRVKSAPDDLEIVREFVNTRDIDAGSDDLARPEHLASWLAARALLEPDAEATERQLRRAVRLREALRELLLANNEGGAPPGLAVTALNELAASVRLRLTVTATGLARLQPDGGGVDAALGRLLIIAYQAIEAGTWSRLKACHNSTCRWAFYDHSKNRSGHWCSMDACGSQQKARAYRQRKRQVEAG